MIRASADPGAPHAFMLVSGGKGLAFQRRRTQSGLTTRPMVAREPLRAGCGCRGGARKFLLTLRSHAAPGASIGTDTIDMNEQVLAGLARVGTRCDDPLDGRILERVGRAGARVDRGRPDTSMK